MRDREMAPTDRLRRSVLAGILTLGLVTGVQELHGQGPWRGYPPGTIEANRAGIFSAEPRSWDGAARLLIPMGARAVGMGRAVTAFQGSESAFWNPAGLARIESNRLGIFRRNDIVGEATAFSLILARQPLGTLTFSYQFLDLGDQDFVDDYQNVLGTISNRDHLGIVSFATQILPWLDTGLNFKVYRAQMSCHGQCPTSGPAGTAYLVDAGLLAFPLPSVPLRIGLMVAHAGPDLQIINVEQADPLPTRLRAAVAYDILTHFLDREDMEFWTTVELEERVRKPGSPVLYLGSEFVAGRADQISVRAGYGAGQPGLPPGLAIGLGIKYQQFEIGIGKALPTSIMGETEPAQVTFGVIF
jgi:hypothetical protein